MSAERKIKWKKHRTPTSIFKAFFGGHPSEFESAPWAGEDSFERYSGEELLKFIYKQGSWAFCETKAQPPVIHYWRGDCSDRQMAFMIGHELGHITGKPYRGKSAKSDYLEECRADEYGRVAAEVLDFLGRSKP